MQNVIKLLEQLGQEASLQNSADIATAIECANISEEIKNLIIEGNITALQNELDICPDIVCIVAPAEDDEPSEDDSEEESTEITLAANG